MLKSLMVLTMLFCYSVSVAATEAPVIVHINGINTTFDEASDNAKVLSGAIKEKGLSNKSFLAYNYSYSEIVPYLGSAIDAVDAAIQGIVSAFQAGIKYSFDFTTKAIFFWDTSGVAEDASNTLQNTLDKIIATFMAFTDIKLGDAFSVLNDIDKKTGSSAPLVLVPHSQGNFYANYIYSFLARTRSVQIVGVATPAPFTAGNGDYVNSSNDRVVSLIVPSARPANITIPETASDSMGHSFVDVYLNPLLLVNGVAIGREMVISKIIAAVSKVENQTAQAPAPQVVLSWTGNYNLALIAQNSDGTPVQATTTISSSGGTATFTMKEATAGSFQILMVSSLSGLWPNTVSLSVGTVSVMIPIGTYIDYPDGTRYLDSIYIKPDGT